MRPAAFLNVSLNRIVSTSSRRRRFSISRPSGLAEYNRHHALSLKDPQQFWGQVGRDLLEWSTDFRKTSGGTFAAGDVRYFTGGSLNVCENLLDRHVEAGKGTNVALYWEGDSLGESQAITFEQLLQDVCKMSHLLTELGVAKGDVVALIAGQVPYALITLLACARIGAIQTVIFAGFSSDAVGDRIREAKAKVVVTSDEGMRGGKSIPLKQTVDRAIQSCPSVTSVLVNKRTHKQVNMKEGRDFYLDQLIPNMRPWFPAVQVDSEHPLFILYTSGSTGKPKGLLHTSAGYLTYVTLASKMLFKLESDSIHASMADVGWIAQQSLGIYGPLSNGVSTVMFESLPTHPQPNRYWEMVERLKVTSFFTAPTAIRALMKHSEDHVNQHDLSSLRALGVAGEPINPVAFNWFHRVVGKSRVHVCDNYWLTESGCALLASLPGIHDSKPGSAGFPFYGIEPVMLDEDGALGVKNHWPGMARTCFGDHSRYLNTYIDKNQQAFVLGDAATVDDQGRYTISGRTDDVILKGGHRVGTAEIESALISDGLCVESAVVVAPHDVMGEQIVAFCIAASTNALETQEELIGELKHAVRMGIGGIAVPDVIHIVEDLPKTRSGKIMRRMLRACARGEYSKLGDTSTLADTSVISAIVQQLKQK